VLQLPFWKEAMSVRLNLILCVAFTAAVAAAVVCNCHAQEVGFVDLTKITPHTELRHPPSIAETRQVPKGGVEQDDERCSTSSSEGELRTTLVSLDRTYYQVGDEPIFEVMVENVNPAPLQLPFSPHLADLQPENPSQKFSYSELGLVLWIAGGKGWSANTGGGTSLYGADDHPQTIVTLNQGEWVRIVGMGKLTLPADGFAIGFIHSGHPVDHVYAQASLYRVGTVLTPTATAKVRRKLCLKYTEGQSVPTALSVPQS
jgi:hypothetical protein